MPALTLSHVDLIEELAYRSWARRNYLPLERRDADWHPIILDEMASRDRELGEEADRREQFAVSPGGGFVPLIPVVTHYVHPGQSEVREPHYLTATGDSGNYHPDSIYAGGRFPA